jgi:hypothetical protein
VLNFRGSIRVLFAAGSVCFGSVFCCGQAWDTYLAVAIRLRADDRTPQVVKISEISGRLVPRVAEDSELIYEVVRDGETTTINSLVDDPFTTRGFAVPGGTVEGKSHTESATIFLNIPHANMEEARSGKIGVRFYRLRSKVRVADLTADKLRTLSAEGKAYVQFDLPRKCFASQIKRLF